MTFKEHFEVSDAQPLYPTEAKGKWVRLIPNIDLGHLLTMVGFAAALTVQWGAMDKRIAIVEEQQKQLTSMILESKTFSQQTLRETQNDVRETKELINQLRTSVAVVTYKIDAQNQQPQRK